MTEDFSNNNVSNVTTKRQPEEELNNNPKLRKLNDSTAYAVIKDLNESPSISNLNSSSLKTSTPYASKMTENDEKVGLTEKALKKEEYLLGEPLLSYFDQMIKKAKMSLRRSSYFLTRMQADRKTLNSKGYSYGIEAFNNVLTQMSNETENINYDVWQKYRDSTRNLKKENDKTLEQFTNMIKKSKYLMTRYNARSTNLNKNCKNLEKNTDLSAKKEEKNIFLNASRDLLSKNNEYHKALFRNEPCASPDFLVNFEKKKQQRLLKMEAQILLIKAERDKFNQINRENCHVLLQYRVRNVKVSDIIEPIERSSISFYKLSPEQEERINQVLECRQSNFVFIEKFNLTIRGSDIVLLNNNQWLNDELINFYMNLIQERSETNNLPNVYAFNTFFYTKLISGGYSSVRRWTRRVDIFSKDIIVIPIHLGVHWCLAIIDFRSKSINYYDSLLHGNNKCLDALEQYLIEEFRDKKKSEYTSSWKKTNMKHIPQQLNGNDCGVFACIFAEFIARDEKLLFTQKDIPYFRRKMVIEIINGILLS